MPRPKKSQPTPSFQRTIEDAAMDPAGCVAVADDAIAKFTAQELEERGLTRLWARLNTMLSSVIRSTMSKLRIRLDHPSVRLNSA